MDDVGPNDGIDYVNFIYLCLSLLSGNDLRLFYSFQDRYDAYDNVLYSLPFALVMIDVSVCPSGVQKRRRRGSKRRTPTTTITAAARPPDRGRSANSTSAPTR